MSEQLDQAPVVAATGAEPTCVGCGATGDEGPLSGSRQSSAQGLTVLCDRCTRDNLRSIEARLDEIWW